LASRPPPIPRSATTGDASASASTPKGATTGGGEGQRPQAPSPPTMNAGDVAGTSAAVKTQEV